METKQTQFSPVFRLGDVMIYKTFLNRAAQENLVEAVREVAKAAPFFSPETPYEKKMSVQMTSAGQFGWFSDRTGYRYETKHPSGKRWPEIPAQVLEVWRAVSGVKRDPECCLVNFYGEGARMGMHIDKDEADYSNSVVSISLGDAGLFRLGTTTRDGKTKTHWLESGDVLVMGGKARLAYHGIDKIRFGSSRLLPKNGRINLTLRVVT